LLRRARADDSPRIDISRENGMVWVVPSQPTLFEGPDTASEALNALNLTPRERHREPVIEIRKVAGRDASSEGL
jgi:hypothetical protein